MNFIAEHWRAIAVAIGFLWLLNTLGQILEVLHGIGVTLRESSEARQTRPAAVEMIPPEAVSRSAATQAVCAKLDEIRIAIARASDPRVMR